MLKIYKFKIRQPLMSIQFYREKPFFKRLYLFPIYVLPLLISLTNSYQIVPLFTVLFSIFMFLLTCWSIKLKIFLTMYSCKNPNYIFYEKSLCKLNKNTFVKNNSKFFIDNDKIIQLKPDINRKLIYYKKNYKNENFICPKLLQHFPKNFFKIEPPTFLKEFSKHAVSPFFVFQIFCGILWCLDEYIYQSLFTLIMLVFVEAGLVFQRIFNLKQFRTLNHEVIILEKLEEKEVVNIESKNIYPGDILKINNILKAPCDLLILDGSCVANESILTGESIPQSKEDIKDLNDDMIFDIELHKKHVIFAGTDIIKIDKPLTCFVLQTGFDTVQGELIKKMMSSTDEFVDVEAFMFIGILLFFAIIAACYTWREGLKMKKTGYKIFLECILIITNVVPTELPLEMSLAINSCVSALRNLNIFCLESFRIPFAGKLNVCCFDKTGTLTESKMDVINVEYTNQNTVDVLRTCHSLVYINKDTNNVVDATIKINLKSNINKSVNTNSELTGDPLEISAYEFLNKIVSSSKGQNTNLEINQLSQEFKNSVCSTINKKYNIKKKYLFSSELKRMTVIYENNKKYYVSCKGAPEVIKGLLVNVPEYFDKYLKYAEEGYRVIALAHKQIDNLKDISRCSVESNFLFAGFLLLDCKLKEHAMETIKDLQESDFKVIMITGDNLLTALNVAKKLGICNKNEQGIQDTDILPALESNKFENFLVYARASPYHKEKIIEKYNKKGFYTLMCGDGTNDVGALKMSHVGVALVETSSNKVSNNVKQENEKFNKNENIKKLLNDETIKLGDASIAAPFTARTKSLESVLNIIRQGRSALVTTIQMYKILALNSLITAFSLSVLDCLGIRFSEYQLVASGILIAFAFVFLTKSKPLKKISKEKPVQTVFSKYILTSIFSQSAVHISLYLFLLRKLRIIEQIEFSTEFKPSITNSAIFLLTTGQQISTFLVNYIGRPFRESLIENKKLLGCLTILLCSIFYILFDINSDFNSMMEIVSLEKIRWLMCGVVVGDLAICFLIEKICFKLFML